MNNPLDSWSSSRRRLLVGVLALTMLAVPAGRVFQSDLAVMSLAQRESAGLLPAWEVLQLVQSAQRHRGLANGVLVGGEDLATGRQEARDALLLALARAGQAIAELHVAQLAADFERIDALSRELIDDVDARRITAAESFERHSSLIARELSLVTEIADGSGVSMHGELAGYRLQAAVLQHLPRVAESLGRMRGEGTRLLTQGHSSIEDRLALGAEGAEARNRSSDAIEALRRSGVLAGTHDLAAAVDAASVAVDDALAVVQREFLDGGELTAPADEYFAAMTAAIDRQYHLIALGSALLRERLAADYSAARWHLVAEAGAVLLLACLGFWLLALANRAQRAQEASDARSHAIIDAAPEALIIVDAAGGVVQVNPAARRLFGTRELDGQPLVSLFAATAREQVAARFEAVQAGTAQPDADVLEVAVVDGQDRQLEAEFLCFAAGTGGQNQTIAMIRDCSERNRLEMQLRQSQKMEAIGQLTGGIAHDFNNLLGVIVGNLDLLERDVANQPVAMGRVNTAVKAAMRGADLTRRLLTFSRRQHLEPTRLQLADAVANVVEMASRTLGPDIRINTEVASNTPEVLVDAAGIENVLLNLMVNARDAMPQGGAIGIETSSIEIDRHHPAVRSGELAPGLYASLRVSDTGEGIAPHRLEKVFEPFFTTKEAGKGTGLGLAMVYGFVKQSGGHVKIYSEVGVGTSVAIVLPIAGSSAGQMPVLRLQDAEHRASPGATALVVDDEPELQEVAATYLNEMGYRVLTASDGANALRLLEGEAQVDLLVTDVIMPGMNGVVLSQQARQHMPGLRVVFTSGFPAEALAQRDSTRIDGPLVNKPFQRREFAGAVGRTMQEKCA